MSDDVVAFEFVFVTEPAVPATDADGEEAVPVDLTWTRSGYCYLSFVGGDDDDDDEMTRRW